MANLRDEISPLQLRVSRDFSGLTTSNHLSNAYLTEPEKMEGVLAYAFGMTNNNVLNMLTGGIGNMREVNNRQYRWEVHGQTEITVNIGADVADPQPGIGNSEFLLALEEDHYEASDNLRLDDGTMIRLSDDGFPDGGLFWYRAQLVDTDKDYIDPSVLTSNNRVSKLYSTVEEYSSKGGGTHYSTPVELVNQLTTLRKYYKVSRNAAKEVMIMELRDPNDPKKSTKLWTKLAEWTALAQWQREIDRSMIYTQFNSSPVGTTMIRGQNKRPVYHGAGIRQKISPSNIQYFSNLTYTLLDDFLLKLSYSANAWGGDQRFVALTGKMGMREFDRAIRNEQNARGITVTDNGTFISGTGQELTFQGQFRTVKFLNGVELTVKEFDPYNDLTHNRELHPITQKPVESYRMTILNFGMKNGKNNIRKVCLKDSENAMWYTAGSTDPFGGVAKSMSTLRSGTIDGYRVDFLAECGIQMQDPTSAGELIFNIDA